jgi:hypothetical protein
LATTPTPADFAHASGLSHLITAGDLAHFGGALV